MSLIGPNFWNEFIQGLFGGIQLRREREDRARQQADITAQRELQRQQMQMALEEHKRRAILESQQTESDALPIGEFAKRVGRPLRQGVDPTQTLGTYRRSGVNPLSLLADPEEEARRQIEAAELLAKLGLGQVDVSGALGALHPGLKLPTETLPAPPSMLPAPGQGVGPEAGGATALYERPKPVYFPGPRQEPVVNVPGIGPMPANEAAKIIGPEGVRDLMGIQRPPTPPAAETPQARRQRVTAELQKLQDDIRSSVSAGDPEGAARAAQAFNARKSEAARYGVTVPYPDADINAVAATAKARKLHLERPPQGPEALGAVLDVREAAAEQRAAQQEVAKAQADFAAATGRARSLQAGGARLGVAFMATPQDTALDRAWADATAAQARLQAAQQRLQAAREALQARRGAPAGAGAAQRVTPPGRPQPTPAKSQPQQNAPPRKTVTRSQLKAYADAYFKGDLNAAKKRVEADGFTVTP